MSNDHVLIAFGCLKSHKTFFFVHYNLGGQLEIGHFWIKKEKKNIMQIRLNNAETKSVRYPFTSSDQFVFIHFEKVLMIRSYLHNVK